MANISMSRFEKRSIVIPKLRALGLEIDEKTSWYEVVKICEGNDIDVNSLLKHPVPQATVVAPKPKPMGFQQVSTPTPVVEPVIAEDAEVEPENQEQYQVQENNNSDNSSPVDDEEYLV